MRLIVDAHVDLAWNMLTFGRDPMRSAAETRALESASGAVNPQGEALLGYPDHVRGGVAVTFATLHVLPERRKLHDWETLSYADAAQAYRLARRQLEAYQRLVDDHGEAFHLVESRAVPHRRIWQYVVGSGGALSNKRLFVDAQNVTGAIRVYERAGMRIERRIGAYEKRLA